MLKKFYRSLGDSPGEFLGNLILLIFIGPIWLLGNGLVYAWGFIGMVLRFPTPKQIPPVITDDTMPARQKVKAYVDRSKKDVKGLEITLNEDKQNAVIHNKNAKIEVWWYEDSVGIVIDKLDTGYWHTEEEGNIDLHFWAAVGALRNGIKWRRSWLGRKEGWIYSDEMEIWVAVSAGNGMSSYYKFRRRLK